MDLPKGLYPITPSGWPSEKLSQAVAACVDAGARIIQFRDKSRSSRERRQIGMRLRGICERAGARLIINDTPVDASHIGAHGVHLGQQDGCAIRARAHLGPDAIIGRTCQSSWTRAVAAASVERCSYVSVGAMFASATKPEAVVTTRRTLRTWAASLRVPVCAIGGITHDTAAHVIQDGARLVAVCQAVFGDGAAAGVFARTQALIRRCS